jgi:EAL domain-containing protein (putative c-di-GMP-specific phosphodiesterase class I)
MYRAKWDGKNGYAVFETGMQDKAQNRMELEMDLREALEKKEFLLAYQPTVGLRNMRPAGVAALIRWEHPVRGLVQPNDFIPLLEETGLIVDVGRWVLEEACRQGATWREAGYPIGMAVNVSGRQLDTDELVTDIEEALSDSGLEPTALTIEITETTLMRNVEETARRLAAIKDLGVRIAIDDFGTGYSSLAHLQRFPVDALKIDRSFISGLQHNHEGETLIHTLVQLGKALSIETFAEGIEMQQDLSLLRDENCDSGQGFLFAKPLDVAATELFLQDWIENGAGTLAAGQAARRRLSPDSGAGSPQRVCRRRVLSNVGGRSLRPTIQNGTLCSVIVALCQMPPRSHSAAAGRRQRATTNGSCSPPERCSSQIRAPRSPRWPGTPGSASARSTRATRARRSCCASSATTGSRCLSRRPRRRWRTIVRSGSCSPTTCGVSSMRTRAR